MHTNLFGIAIVCAFAWIPFLIEFVKAREVAGDREARQMFSAIAAAEVLAVLSAWLLPAFALPGSGWIWLVVGVLVICLGASLRHWARLTLGTYFRLVVSVQPDQQVIRSGPYHFVRHPAYSALLLNSLGFGIAMGNLWSIVVALGLPVIGLLPRIRHEERALESGMGSGYRTYAADTKRLIPHIW